MADPDWYRLLKRRHAEDYSPRMWALLDHMAQISDGRRKNHTGAHIAAGATLSTTSDGFMSVSAFVTGSGSLRLSAFWGSRADHDRNVADVATLLQGEMKAAYIEASKAILGQDWRH